MVTSEAFFTRKQTELGVALNDMQKQAVLHTDGPLLLLATPGSGKTTTIIMRIGYLIEELHIAPNKIKAVTFSKAAAGDMSARYEKFFPTLEAVDFSTIHSLAFDVVRDYFYNRNEQYQLIEGNNIGPFNKNMILRNIYQEINNRNITQDQLDELLSYISFIKNKLIPREKWHTVKCEVTKALEIFEQYEIFKREGTEQLLLDYDDMLTIAHTAFETVPQLLANYQARYEYVLTDESQDTSLVQHAIIEKLVQGHQNICVVADDDQSIYTWRAAEPQYLLNFKDVYPHATVLTMEQNYRSSENIVATANQFIKQNKNRYDKNMFTENDLGRSIIFRTLPDYRGQATYLVDKIMQSENYVDTAILYRNNLSAIVLVDAFDKANIPFYMKDTNNRFFEHWIVEDVLNFMRLAYDDTRVTTLEKIFSKFNGYISKVQLETLKREPSKRSVFDRLSENPHLKDYQVKNLNNIKGYFKDITLCAPPEIIKIIREKLGYDNSLERISSKFGFNITYIHEILHILGEISIGTNTMEEFAKRLNYLKKRLKEASKNKENNAVTLSTLHSSKGLEFKEVYLIDLVEGNLPAATDIEEFEEGNMAPMEEAVRLFYVGMTRAESRLELVSYRRKIGVSADVSRFYQITNEIVNPEVRKVIPKNKSRQISPGRKTESVVAINPNSISQASVLQEGVIVDHRVFGKGTITRRAKDSVEIQFVKEAKTLLIETCIEKGVFELVE